MIEWNLNFQFVHLVQISLRWKLWNDTTLHIFSLVWFMAHPQSPEGLDDVRGDGGSSFVGVGLPRQRHAVLGHVRHYGFVRRTWQLEGLRGLGHRRVCALWTDRRRQKEGGEGVKKKPMENWLKGQFFFFFFLLSPQCDSANVACRLLSPSRLEISHLTAATWLITNNISVKCQTTN